jgi:proteic killer suppression protein
MDIFEVRLAPKLEKSGLTKVPKHIVTNLMDWVDDVREFDLRETRKVSSYHDEPVKGKERAGQRSIRLSKAWRAFYIIDKAGTVEFVEVMEINKHEY